MLNCVSALVPVARVKPAVQVMYRASSMEAALSLASVELDFDEH